MKNYFKSASCCFRTIIIFNILLLRPAYGFCQEGNINSNAGDVNVNDRSTQYGSILSSTVNCDSLNRDNNILVLDTVLKRPSEVLLVPRFGTVEGSWNPATFLNCSTCQTPTAYPQSNIVYIVTLKDDYQCIHQERFQIKLELTVYNVITPNNDGVNDCLKISGMPDGTPMKIFDKSGLLVYSTDAYNNTNCWSGTDNSGESLIAGTYWYVLDNPWQGVYQKGFVLIVR
jgi:gliding motility-associated-like protein